MTPLADCLQRYADGMADHVEGLIAWMHVCFLFACMLMHYALMQAGVRGFVFDVLRSMYQGVKSVIRHCGTFSEVIEHFVGVRQ
jgi:hypothetical protein